MCAGPEGGHLGGSLSLVEVLTTLYFSSLNITAANVDHPDRDIVILSKGHAGAALYATLVERGILPAEHTDRYGQPGAPLGGHPSPHVPGIEVATGSLGHGLGIGVGYALARRLQGRPGRVVVVLGDGELQEGAVWEAALVAAARRLGNLTAVVDKNGLQQSTSTAAVLGSVDPAAGLGALGWTIANVDGHDLRALGATLAAPTGAGGSLPSAPLLVVAETVKARGIAFLERKVGSHFVTLDESRLARSLQALTSTGPGAGGS
nr:1-deoxy-D-xylulose-5-phosphate synthase N-terminal domain-containing protein [Nocardioides pantholopis]